MNDDQRLLASAALDGAVTAEERARAESDPEVVAEVERLRAVRGALSVVEPPDADRRDVAIAAALAAFARSGTVAPPSGAVVAPLPPARSRRGHRWLAPLAAAAAVAVIAVGGIVATRSSDDEDSSSADRAAEQSVQTASDASDATDGALSALPAPADREAAGDAADADAATEATTRPTDAAPSAGDAASELAPTAAAAPLASPDELAEFAELAGTTAASDAGPTATCSGGTFLGEASYVVDGAAVPVEVFEVETPHQAVARRIGDCRVVARAPLP